MLHDSKVLFEFEEEEQEAPHCSYPNTTQIPRISKFTEYDNVLITSSPAIGIIAARKISESGSSVCVLIKSNDKVGFEPLFSDLSFLRYLCRELNIDVGTPCTVLDLVGFVAAYASNKELIKYMGENYNFVDLGYDGIQNHFLTYESIRRLPTTADKVIVSSLGCSDAWYKRYLPRHFKMHQIIGSQMMVFRWFDFLNGWGTREETSKVKFKTSRPNVNTFFGADTIHLNLDEPMAKKILFSEAEKLISFLKKI